MALLTPSIVAGNLQAADDFLKQKELVAKAVAAPYLAHYWELDDINLPSNAIAVVYLTGMLYAWETDWLIKTLQAAEANPAVCGIVLVIDGPGGHVTRIDVAAAAIKESTKPVPGSSRVHVLRSLLAGDLRRSCFLPCHSFAPSAVSAQCANISA